jgi:hypothetical protein
MKKLFSDSAEVMHVFAQQSQARGRNGFGNIFFEGTKIYSYGYHYLLAEFIDENTVMINDEGYSVTTSKHIAGIRYATNHKKQFYTTSTDIDLVHAHITRYLLPKLAKARKPELYTGEILYLWNSLNEFLDYTNKKGIKNRRKYRQLKSIVANFESDDLFGKYNESLKRKAANERANRKKQEKKLLANFMAYKNNGFNSSLAYVRISKDGSNVETSQGAKVPVKEAALLYRMILAGKDIKGYKIGYYTVIGINGTLRIGCHNIDKNSMHETGKKLLKL